jgi:hypothetical protein
LFSNAALSPGVAPDPRLIIGPWSFYHDGWPERLVIEPPRADGTYPAQLRSSLFESRFRARVVVGCEAADRVLVTVEEFNELDQQVFEGYLWTGSGVTAMAGRTDWKGTPFGFYAVRSALVPLSPSRSSPVAAVELVGRWNLCGGGLRADLRIDAVGNGESHGELLEPDGTRLPARVTVGGDVRHAVRVEVAPGHGQPPARLDGFMWSRSRQAMAGLIEWNGVRSGWYATWAGGQPRP